MHNHDHEKPSFWILKTLRMVMDRNAEKWQFFLYEMLVNFVILLTDSKEARMEKQLRKCHPTSQGESREVSGYYGQE